MATENRVPCNDKETTNKRDVLQLENSTFIPSDVEQRKQKSDYKVLIGRVITTNIPCLEFLKDVSVDHIQHKYSDLTSKPKETVIFVSYTHLTLPTILLV